MPVNAVLAQDETDHTLSFDSTGRPLIVGLIDSVPGVPLVFRIDTGASDSVVYDSAALKLILSSTPYEARYVYTATGRKRRPTYVVGGFSSLGASLKVARTVSLPDPMDRSAVGLLGVDLFKDKILMLDPFNNHAALIGVEQADKAGLAKLKGRPVAAGSIAITLSIGGVNIPAFVDTGAEKTVINSAALRVIRRTMDQGLTRKDGPLQMLKAGAGSDVVDQYRLSTVMLGDEELRDQTVYHADLSIFRQLGARRAPALILGMDILSNRVLIFDFKRFLLFVGEKR